MSSSARPSLNEKIDKADSSTLSHRLSQILQYSSDLAMPNLLCRNWNDFLYRFAHSFVQLGLGCCHGIDDGKGYQLQGRIAIIEHFSKEKVGIQIGLWLQQISMSAVIFDLDFVPDLFYLWINSSVKVIPERILTYSIMSWTISVNAVLDTSKMPWYPFLIRKQSW